MVRLRIDLAYDGAPFRGFARQRDVTTVQGTLEGALARLLGAEVSTTCAGRTDRGVHALAQVVHLDLPQTPRSQRWRGELERLRVALDDQVREAITIWRVVEVDDGFDARFTPVERRYRYRIVDAPTIDPIRRHDAWHVKEPLRLRPMQRAAKHLLGEHDFASLCRKAAGKHTVRRIDAITVARAVPGELHIKLRGPAFCHQQVRSIAGCLVEVGKGRRDPDWLAEVLGARDRDAAAAVAPPEGLTLVEVRFPRPYDHAPPV